jgi:Type IX secretion system membrane protein PorP/SprF
VDLNVSSGETTLDRPSFLVPDISTGIGFQMAASDEVNIYVGGALFHLNEPNMGMSTGVQRLLNRKLHTYAAADIMIGENFTLSPRVIYARQGDHSELNGGVSGRFLFGRNAINDDPNAFLVGIMYRLDNNDALYPMARFDYGPIAFALTYDVNLSKLAPASIAQGGPELAIIYKTNLNGTGTHNASHRREMPCPKW